MITLQDLISDLKRPICVEIQNKNQTIIYDRRSDRIDETLLHYQVLTWSPDPPPNKGYADIVVCLQFPEGE